MAILTFKDLYEGIIKRIGESTSDTNLVNNLKDWINLRYKEVCSLAEWPFMEAVKSIYTVDKYDTGTIDITTDTAAVTGTSTVWTKDMAEYKIKFNDSGQITRISNVSSTTGITLKNSYYGDTIDDGDYTIFKNEYLCSFTWENIEWLKSTRDNRMLEKKDIRQIYEETPASYAGNTDPDKYALFEDRILTKIGIDTFNLSYTIANVSSEHWFSGANGAYGWVKGKGTDADSNDYLILQILYGTLADNEAITFYSDVGVTATGVTCAVDQSSYTAGNVGNSLLVLFEPSPYRNTLYECKVKLKPVDMSLDTDEPLIPADFRDILFYFGLADLYDYRSKPELRTYYEAKALSRINAMVAKLKIKFKNFPRIRPAYSRIEYS